MNASLVLSGEGTLAGRPRPPAGRTPACPRAAGRTGLPAAAGAQLPAPLRSQRNFVAPALTTTVLSPSSSVTSAIGSASALNVLSPAAAVIAAASLAWSNAGALVFFAGSTSV